MRSPRSNLARNGEAGIDKSRESVPRNRRAAIALLIGFSLLYFADICLRASAKYYWFDELLTVHICRLPNLRAVYRATMLGTDFNPPLFHILTRLAQTPFGEGLVASRMPSIIGVWLLCVCLFAVVSKRAGWAAGTVAMLLPLLTSARYYAYEARATGIVLGLAGLAMLAWQRWGESRYRKVWLGVFCVSLLGAFLTHCYAVTLVFPFSCAEAFRSWRKRRLDPAVWVLMGCAVLAVLPIYVPLLRAFQKHVGAAFFPPGIGSLQSFYTMLLAPATLALVVCLAAFVIDCAASPEAAPPMVPGEEIVLAIGFLSLPLAGLILAVVIHGPFIGRYWFPAILGVCLAVGYRSGGRTKWVAPCLGVALACLVAGDFARLVRHRLAGEGEVLVEPNTLLPMNTTPGKPLRAYETLWPHAPGDQPIVVADGLEFAFLAYYVSPQTRSRLYYLMADDNDTVGGLLQSLDACCQVTYNVARAQDFVRVNPRFYLYGKSRDPLAALSHAEVPMDRTRCRAFLGDHLLVEVMPNNGSLQ